jgi:predicted transposase YdaD
MKTDALFYELFQAVPQTFFELLQITPTCEYRYESLTVKTSEKRIDGVLEPMDDQQPIYFLEVQAFPDDVIHWRTMREVATYFEQRPSRKDCGWQAIVLWLNKEDDPGLSTLKPLTRKPASRLVSADLVKLLKKLDERALVLNVVRPLLAKSEREVRENVVQWVENIRQMPNLDPQREERLVTILSQFIEQKFRTLTYEELSRMLRLTPLEETISGQTLIKNERVAILTRQIARKFALSAELAEAIQLELNKLDLVSLKALLDQILDIETLEELELWITEHLPMTGNSRLEDS